MNSKAFDGLGNLPMFRSCHNREPRGQVKKSISPRLTCGISSAENRCTAKSQTHNFLPHSTTLVGKVAGASALLLSRPVTRIDI